MESLLPLLANLFTETNAEKRKQIEATLDQAGIYHHDTTFRCFKAISSSYTSHDFPP